MSRSACLLYCMSKKLCFHGAKSLFCKHAASSPERASSRTYLHYSAPSFFLQSFLCAPPADCLRFPLWCILHQSEDQRLTNFRRSKTPKNIRLSASTQKKVAGVGHTFSWTRSAAPALSLVFSRCPPRLRSNCLLPYKPGASFEARKHVMNLVEDNRCTEHDDFWTVPQSISIPATLFLPDQAYQACSMLGFTLFGGQELPRSDDVNSGPLRSAFSVV